MFICGSFSSWPVSGDTELKNNEGDTPKNFNRNLVSINKIAFVYCKPVKIFLKQVIYSSHTCTGRCIPNTATTVHCQQGHCSYKII